MGYWYYDYYYHHYYGYYYTPLLEDPKGRFSNGGVTDWASFRIRTLETEPDVLQLHKEST